MHVSALKLIAREIDDLVVDGFLVLLGHEYGITSGAFACVVIRCTTPTAPLTTMVVITE